MFVFILVLNLVLRFGAAAGGLWLARYFWPSEPLLTHLVITFFAYVMLARSIEWAAEMADS